MNGIVVYKSKSGYTKRYAEMIADELSFDLKPSRGITPDDLVSYDTIIYGGGLYIRGINGAKLIIRNLSRFSGKKVILFACGATPPRETDIQTIKDANFTESDLNQIRFFYMRGGFDFSKLQFLDKFLMILLKIKLKSRKEIKGDELGMLNAYDHPMDFVNKKNITELVRYVREEGL